MRSAPVSHHPDLNYTKYTTMYFFQLRALKMTGRLDLEPQSGSSVGAAAGGELYLDAAVGYL